MLYKVIYYPSDDNLLTKGLLDKRVSISVVWGITLLGQEQIY
jgi:hypothetical protein